MDLLEILHADAVRNTQSVGSKKRLFQDLAAIASQSYGIGPIFARPIWEYFAKKKNRGFFFVDTFIHEISR